MKALLLATCQSVHVQPGQGSAAAGSSRLQGFEFVQSLVEPSREMRLVAGYLLQDLLVWQEALPTHPLEIQLHLIRRLLLADDVPPGRVGDHFKQLRWILLGGAGDGIYACSHGSGSPAIVILPLLGVLGHT